MKQLFFFLCILTMLVAGCTAPVTESAPTAALASETPLPSPSVVPSATPVPATPTATPAPLGLPGPVLSEGLGVHVHYEFAAETYFTPEQYKLLKEANLGFVRDDIWPGAACGKPPWCFEYFDALVTKMALIDMRVVWNLRDYENSEIGTEEGRKAFAEFAGDAAEHFRGRGVIWEIWNEPELDEYWRPYANPQAYSLLVEEVVREIRAGDPDAVIIGPSLATLSTVFGNQSWRYLMNIGEAGTLAKFDAVDIHLYNGGSPESQIENLRKLRRLIDSYVTDRRIPITSTEWGYTTGAPFYGHQSSPQEQPKYLVRSFLVKASHEIYLSLWYDWKNDDWAPVGPADANFGVILSDGEPKPAYHALKTLTTTLDGYEFLRRIPVRSNHDYLLLFRKGETGVLAAWTITEPHALAFPEVSEALESISMLGERERLAPGEEGLALQVSDAPQYLLLPEGSFGDQSIFWKPEGTFFRLVEADRGEIPIEIENPTDEERTCALQAILNGETIGASEVILAPGETRIVRLPVQIDAPAEELDFLVQVTVGSEEDLESAWVWVQR